MNKSAWEIVGISETAVYILDVGQGTDLSVTNDAENVVDEILLVYGEKRIVYRDSEGQWDEITHDGVDFTGFAPLSKDEIQLLDARYK